MLNEKELEYLGVLNWHRQGFKGRNAVIASKEDTIRGIFNDLDAIRYEDNRGRFALHGTNVMDYIRQVAPEARKMTAESNGKTINNILYSEGMDYLQKITPDILTTSEFSSSDYREPNFSLYKKLYDNGCFLLCAAGNEGSVGTEKLADGNMWKAIGACRYNKGNPKRATYSSIGEELDYMSFDNLYATWDNKKHTGTSFASPLLAAMLALVQGFFFDKVGKKLTHEKLEEFIKDNCVDLEDKGRDNYTGYGLFILPDPKSIDIGKYADMITIDEIFSYLEEEGELLEADYWKEKIKQEDKIKWLFIKWANAVRMARGRGEKIFQIIQDYNIEDVLTELNQNGYLLEPEYWKTKIQEEDKLKWLFFKWYYATKRVI